MPRQLSEWNQIKITSSSLNLIFKLVEFVSTKYNFTWQNFLDTTKTTMNEKLSDAGLQK